MKKYLACFLVVFVLLGGAVSVIGFANDVERDSVVQVYLEREYWVFQAIEKDRGFLEIAGKILNENNVSDEVFYNLNINYNELMVLVEKYKAAVNILSGVEDKEIAAVVKIDNEIIIKLYSRKDIFEICLAKFLK